MLGNMVGQSIAYQLLKLFQYVIGYRGKLILQPWSQNTSYNTSLALYLHARTDDLAEDEVLSFGVEDLIAEDGRVDRGPTFCPPTDLILTMY